MELSSEDALRLHVLLANKPLAIRIHESRMTLEGLLPSGQEAQIQLNPNTGADRYLKTVRALLSNHALGNPGGYPLYLQRWTRMGQMRAESLEQLLLLGEPTAVFAVVCAAGLTDELARRAWWAMEDAESARRMLLTEQVVQGRMGPALARYLIEYLPFETETAPTIESVRRALQPGLLSPQERDGLWRKAARKNAYLVGFLAGAPDDLPHQRPAHRAFADIIEKPARLGVQGDERAALLHKVFSPTGQAFLDTALQVLLRPNTQDLVVSLLDAIRSWFGPWRPEGDPDLPIEELRREAELFVDNSPQLEALRSALEGRLRDELVAVRLLSGVGYGVVRPIFRDTSAIGSLMRKKLEPVTAPLQQAMELLLGKR